MVLMLLFMDIVILLAIVMVSAFIGGYTSAACKCKDQVFCTIAGVLFGLITFLYGAGIWTMIVMIGG